MSGMGRGMPTPISLHEAHCLRHAAAHLVDEASATRVDRHGGQGGQGVGAAWQGIKAQASRYSSLVAPTGRGHGAGRAKGWFAVVACGAVRLVTLLAAS